MDKNKEKWDGQCQCGHLHSEHHKLTSHNYSAGRCTNKDCKCAHFIHANKSEPTYPAPIPTPVSKETETEKWGNMEDPVRPENGEWMKAGSSEGCSYPPVTEERNRMVWVKDFKGREAQAAWTGTEGCMVLWNNQYEFWFKEAPPIPETLPTEEIPEEGEEYRFKEGELTVCLSEYQKRFNNGGGGYVYFKEGYRLGKASLQASLSSMKGERDDAIANQNFSESINRGFITAFQDTNDALKKDRDLYRKESEDLRKAWSVANKERSEQNIRIAELEEALRLYVKTAGKMLDRWAEGDKEVKADLWKALHALELPARELLNKYPKKEEGNK